MKKILALILTLVIVCTVFASCTAEKPIDEKTSEQMNEEVKLPEKVAVSDFDDLLKKMSEAQKSLESLSTDVKCKIDIQAMEENTKVESDVLLQADIKNNLSHTVVKTISAELEEPTVNESYSDENATYTKDADGEWFRHTTDPERAQELSALMEKLKDAGFDASKYISDGVYEETVYNEKECYKVSFTLDLKLDEMLKEAGLEKEAEAFETGLAQELGPELATQIYELISDLGNVSVEEYVDAYTLYPVSVSLDMTEIFQQLVNKVIDVVLSAYGQGMTAEQLGINVVINELSIQMNAYDLNETTVEIPENVLSAPEFTEDYLQDEYEVYLEEEYSDF